MKRPLSDIDKELLLKPNPLPWQVVAATLTFEGDLTPGENTLTQICPWVFRGCQACPTFPWGVFLIERPVDLFVLDLCVGSTKVLCADQLPMPAFLFEGVVMGTPRKLTGRPSGLAGLDMPTAKTSEVVTLKLRNDGAARKVFAQIHGVRMEEL